jgi:hypothetical protein
MEQQDRERQISENISYRAQLPSNPQTEGSGRQEMATRAAEALERLRGEQERRRVEVMELRDTISRLEGLRDDMHGR